MWENYLFLKIEQQYFDYAAFDLEGFMHLFSRQLTLYLLFSAYLKSTFKLLLHKLLTLKIRI